MRLTRIHTIIIAMILVACDQRSSRDNNEQAQPPSQETGMDEATAAEYRELAEAVVIRVALDSEGQEINGTAEMRVVKDAAVDGGDAYQVASAYERGEVPHTVSSVDELDQSGSVQSWADYRNVTNYGAYQPQVYQQGGNGAYWNYASPSTSQANGNRYYYYNKPSCWPYCAPNQQYGQPGTPGQPGGQPGTPGLPGSGNNGQNLDTQLAGLLRQSGVEPLRDSDFLAGTTAQYELGRMLFFDPLLSGNRNTACSTCHVPQQGTSNGMSLGPTLQARTKRAGRFVTSDLLPRNAPALFNRGHKSFDKMFWDSRIAASSTAPSGFVTPAGDQLPSGLNSALAAQALFPLASRTEMLGCLGENELADSLDSSGLTGVWEGVVDRVTSNQQYQRLLKAAYPSITPETTKIEHLANALAIFQAKAWRAERSPFDRYIGGDTNALRPLQKQGAIYFYGKAACSSCHSGPLLTDQNHHAIAMPQFGPGLDNGRDIGFGAVSGQASDNFKFRTPSLRNVALTAPFGHTGAYNSLRSMVRHYINPVTAMERWNWRQAVMPFAISDESTLLRPWRSRSMRAEIAGANQAQPVRLTDQEVDAIVAFLEALTDQRSTDLSKVGPQSLPSGITPPKPWYPKTDTNNDTTTQPAPGSDNQTSPTQPIGPNTGNMVPNAPGWSNNGNTMPSAPGWSNNGNTMPSAPGWSNNGNTMPSAPGWSNNGNTMPSAPGWSNNGNTMPTAPGFSGTNSNMPAAPGFSSTGGMMPGPQRM